MHKTQNVSIFQNNCIMCASISSERGVGLDALHTALHSCANRSSIHAFSSVVCLWSLAIWNYTALTITRSHPAREDRPHCWRQLYPSAALRRKNDSNHVPRIKSKRFLQLSSYSGTGPWKSPSKQFERTLQFFRFEKKMWNLACRWLPWCSQHSACFYVL